MPRQAVLKPARLASRTRPWCVNVPAQLSPTSKRQQRFFNTQREAQTFCEQLKVRRDNFGASLTAMTPARIAEAGEAYKLLEPLGVSLLEAVRDYVQTHRQRTASVPFGQLFDQFLAAKSTRSKEHRYKVEKTKERFQQLHGLASCDVRPSHLLPTLDALRPAMRNAEMRYLRAVFNLGIKRGYLSENPIARMDFAETKRKEVEIFSPEVVSKLLNTALTKDVEMVPFFVFGFFCGIRPNGELLEVEWRDYREDLSQFVIRPEVSKTHRRRFIDVSDNAAAWVRAYRDRGGSTEPDRRLVPLSFHEARDRRREIFQATAGDEAQWIQTGMRHSYCTFWLAKHGDVNKLVLQSGHDNADTMWRSYHAGVTRAEAEAFWSIRPQAAESGT